MKNPRLNEEGKSNYVLFIFSLFLSIHYLHCTTVSPMFFPDLVEQKKDSYKGRIKKLKEKYENWEQDDCYVACLNEAAKAQAQEDDSGVPTSLELCAGSARLSLALSAVGFYTITLDNDPTKMATSQLDLRQLEDMIVCGHIHDHPYLNKAPSVIWLGPECRTWSRAACGTYRNMHFIDGHENRVKETAALQACRDIESLVNIVAYYKKVSPHVQIVIENPEGYLKHHPVSKLFASILGLTELTISYCRFSTERDLFPRKHTNLWTNASTLISAFGDERFLCKKDDALCKGKGLKNKHIIQVQDLRDKCSAYPPPMCQFIAGLLRKCSVLCCPIFLSS